MVALNLHFEGHRANRQGESHRSDCCTALESREQGGKAGVTFQGGNADPTGSFLASPGPSALIGCCKIWLCHTECDTLPMVPDHRPSATLQGSLPS